REPVLADVVRDVEVLEPRRVLRELEAVAREVEPCRLLDPHAHLDERDEDGEAADRVAGQREDPDGDCRADRQPDEHRRERGRRHFTRRKTIPTTAIPDAMKKT